ncbi:MAG: 6-phospho-3-hexuloisomerase [Methylococcales bacterium]|nr:6-phospho-3-hexuloisomerase [Methylococcales bacterium]MCK5925108.1 6-phospho-3-hexuloisomerase [Methylococcales bacterium]
MWQQENQRLIISKISEILDATEETYAEEMTAMFDGAKRIFISGAGRSKLVGNFLGMRLMHSGYDVSMVGEIVTPSIKNGDLLIIISGSGETEQLIAFTNKAKSVGAKIVLICSKSKSTIGDMADGVFQIGKNDSYATVKGMPMGTVFELSTLCFLESVVSHLIWEKEIPEEKMRERHANME